MDRPRTRRRAMARIIQIVRELAPIHRMHVSYSTGPDWALAIRDGLADAHSAGGPCASVIPFRPHQAGAR